jgi:4-hydroxy 2-oxovalerate aldolase
MSAPSKEANTSGSALTLLDVTLRDGGFHNGWDFTRHEVDHYLRAMDEAKVDWAEIGYRTIVRDGFAGALRYSEEAFIDALPPLKHTRLGLMVDAKDFAGRDDALLSLFPPADRSRVDLVRVAVRPKDLDLAIRQVGLLHDRGYLTTINLMAWASIPEVARHDLIVRLAKSQADVSYIADSYGSMHPTEVAAAVHTWRETLATLGLTIEDRPFGVHLHNNLELAFANALAAIEAGATWVDASVIGMGRGPGNLKTELILQHLETRQQHPYYRTAPVYDLISRTWDALHRQYGWGPSAPYVLSGHLAVHPTYAQDLLESGRYTVSEVTTILHTLHHNKTGSSFSRQALDAAISSRTTTSTTPAHDLERHHLDAFRGPDWSDREVLVVGRGPSTLRHAAAINRYIEKCRPIVLECNHVAEVAQSSDHLSCFIVAANAQRMVPDALTANKSVLLGFARGGQPAVTPTLNTFLEPYEVTSHTLSTDPCVIPADVISMFAIAQAVRRGVTKVSVVGFDGYVGSTSGREQRMQKELEEFFALLSEQHPRVEVTSLTPTGFPIRVRSIYGEVALNDLSEPGA